MTVDNLLIVARQQDIQLEARRDVLHFDAPTGVLTAELRAELVHHKPALLVLLAPVTEFVPFLGGLVLPRPAVLLALDLEHRGFRMSLDAWEQFQIEPAATLTEADVVAIRLWRLHLSAIIGYNADAHKPAA